MKHFLNLSAISFNVWRVCEALSVAKDLGERKRTAYLLLSECDSTEASVSERRVRLGGVILFSHLLIKIRVCKGLYYLH